MRASPEWIQNRGNVFFLSCPPPKMGKTGGGRTSKKALIGGFWGGVVTLWGTRNPQNSGEVDPRQVLSFPTRWHWQNDYKKTFFLFQLVPNFSIWDNQWQKRFFVFPNCKFGTGSASHGKPGVSLGPWIGSSTWFLPLKASIFFFVVD